MAVSSFANRASRYPYASIAPKSASDSVENLLYKSNNQGYLMKLFTNITEFINKTAVCARCTGVMRCPCILTKGGPHITVCLSCRKRGEESVAMENIKRGSLILEVKCPLEERGCAWVGKLSAIEGHMENCGEFKLECPQKCNFVTKRSEMENHTKNQCPMRVVECEHCKEKMCYRELETHFIICPEYPLKCVCGERHRRKNIEIHKRDKCLETVIECEYKEFGCEKTFKRILLESHLKENEEFHKNLKLTGLEAKVEKLEKEQSNRKAVELENERLKLENEQLRKMNQFNLVHDWTINTRYPTGDTKHDVSLPYSSYKLRFDHVPTKKELKLWVSFENFQRGRGGSACKFWTVLVNQDDKKLCGTPEGNVEYIYVRDNIATGRDFEIGTFSPEIVEEFSKNGLLNVKVYYVIEHVEPGSSMALRCNLLYGGKIQPRY